MNSLTLFALALSAIKTRVLTCVIVSVAALLLGPANLCALAACNGKNISATEVFLVGHQFHVIRIAAAAHAAGMVGFDSFRDRSIEMLEGNAVNSRCSFVWSLLDTPISLFIEGSHEYPTSGFGDHLNLGHQAINQWCKLSFRHCDSPIKSRCSEPPGTSNAVRLVLHYTPAVLS